MVCIDLTESFQGKSMALSPSGVDAASRALAVGRPEIFAVLEVETSGCGFLPDRRPQILYERHIFHNLTGGRFDDGDISDATPGGYGPTGPAQYLRLSQAIGLDRSAALQSTSWGLGQVMGMNYRLAGFADVESMVQAMVDSEDAHVLALASFVNGSKLASALQNHDWAGFASRYNGPAYASNKYDTKLADAFARYSGGAMPDLDLRAAQLYLTFQGYEPGPIDGVPGPRTQAAIMSFQQRHNLPATGILDAELIALMIAELTVN
jgi:hypothetical protein